jgi:hypothetical protein
MRKGVPLLKDDAKLLAKLVEVGGGSVNLSALDLDPAAVDLFQTVYAGEQSDTLR